MPWVIRDVVNDVNKAVARRWQTLDPLLPEPGDLPEGCAAPLLTRGGNGRPAGIGVCRHQHVPADTLAQTWGPATKFVLTLRLRDADTGPAADDLLAQWRAHVREQPQAADDDTAAVVNWPARDITGVRALLGHGLVPMAVIAARPRPQTTAAPAPAPHARPQQTPPQQTPPHAGRLLIRHATPADLDVVTEFELGVITYDAHFGGSIPRPATPDLVRAQTQAALAGRPGWTWLAEQDGRPVALVTVEPPDAATWIAGMARPGKTAYLATGFVHPAGRGSGLGAALVEHVHRELDDRGIGLTLLHHSQHNPLSAPFWHRMGYRPLWTTWEARPAVTLC